MHIVSNHIIQTSTVQGHPGSKFIVPIETLLVVCCLTCFKSSILSVTIFEVFAAKIADLDLGRFKVIQGQSSWCQSIAHGWFPIRLLLTQSLYLSPFSQYLTCNLMPVQGHPGSKYIAPIESPSAVSYLTSFESNVVSGFIFEIFDKKVL